MTQNLTRVGVKVGDTFKEVTRHSLFSISYCLRRFCVLTSVLVAASEAVGFFAVAEPVDERAQLPHVPHPPRHHHLLLDDVSLRKVRPSLWQKTRK